MKNKSKIKKDNQNYKQKYFEFYDDVKDHTKGFKEDWWIIIQNNK